jgi:taurine--2-oxoglutarate transaminase
LIGEVRGQGVFWAMDLVTDRSTRAPLAPYAGSSAAMNELIAECKKRGLMPFTNYNRMHVVPPCNISEAEVLEGISIIDESLANIANYYEGKD